jgi:hypothetical protein
MVWDDQAGAWTVSSLTYLINSTMLGGELVTEVNNTGRKLQTYVIAAGAVIARQKVNTPDTSPTESVSWEHRDPGDTQVKYTNSSGSTSTDFISDHYDTIGRMVGHPSFTAPSYPPHRIPSPFEEIPDELGGGGGCQVEVDGMSQDCDTVSADNTHAEFRHGNKVYSAPLQEILPGSGVFTVNMTFSEAGYSGTDVFEKSEGEPVESASDERFERSVSVSFTLSWNFAQSRDPFKKFRSDKKLSDDDCDKHLSDVFGGLTLAMEGAGDLDAHGGRTRVSRTPHSAQARNDLPRTMMVPEYNERTGKTNSVRMSNPDRGGILHTYANEKGTADASVPLTAPGGWLGVTPYYIGGNSGLRFNYSNGVTIDFVHVGTTNSNNIPSRPQNSLIGSLVDIGTIGGAGGRSSPNYDHTHIVFIRTATGGRIDPRELFCGF